MNELDLKLEELMKASGGKVDHYEETELKKDMRATKASGKTFEEWLNGSKYLYGSVSIPAFKTIMQYLWDTDC